MSDNFVLRLFATHFMKVKLVGTTAADAVMKIIYRALLDKFGIESFLEFQNLQMSKESNSNSPL